MYEMVFSSLGLTTFSNALTRRLVVLMAESSAKKDVYRNVVPHVHTTRQPTRSASPARLTRFPVQ
jgi:hypothetical protein